MTTPFKPGEPDPAPQGEISAATRKHLIAVRTELLGLHKSILDAERAAYERDHGRIESPHALLQLVMHDPWFGWFRPLSEMAVQIDELLDPSPLLSGQRPQSAESPNSAAPGTEAEAQALLRELRSLIAPAEEGEEFATKYRAILQADPSIILAHARLSELLQA